MSKQKPDLSLAVKSDLADFLPQLFSQRLLITKRLLCIFYLVTHYKTQNSWLKELGFPAQNP